MKGAWGMERPESSHVPARRDKAIEWVARITLLGMGLDSVNGYFFIIK